MPLLMRTILACLVAAVLAGCTADTPEDTDPSPSASATAGSGEVRYIFYMLGNQLLRFNVDTSFSAIIADLPSDQVAVAPDGRKAVFVQESSAKAAPSGGFREPVIRIGRTGRRLYNGALTLGAGSDPVWNQLDGTSVAALDLKGEEVVYDASAEAGQEGEPLPSDAEWAARAWDPLDELAEVEGAPEGAVIAAWAPDGSTVAVASKRELVLIDVETGDATPVPRSEGVEGVAWASDGSTFAFVLRKGNELRNVYLCTTAEDCEFSFSWRNPVQLIALTP